MEGEVLLKLSGVRRSYLSGGEEVEVLHGIDLEVRQGEMLAIVGPSGSGKSTLMNIIGCLDTPTDGSYTVRGQDTLNMLPDELAALRRDFFGFIFQRYHLLGHLSAAENVQVPAVYAGVRKVKRDERAVELLTSLGLEERVAYVPSQLSGGQQQRAAIARALATDPVVVLADEPTGNLDTATSIEIMQLFQEMHKRGKTIVMVTHEPDIAAWAEHRIVMRDGLIKEMV